MELLKHILPKDRHKTEASKDLQRKLTVRPSRIPNVLDYFRGRETGSKSFYEGASGSAEYLRLRTTQNVLLGDDNINAFGDIIEVEAVKGLNNSIVALFRCEPNPNLGFFRSPCSFIYQSMNLGMYTMIEHKFKNIAIAENDDSVFFKKTNYATDLCEGPDSTIATANNEFGKGYVTFINQNPEMDVIRPVHDFYEDRMYFCCTTKEPGVNIAVGSEDIIRVVNPAQYEDVYSVPGYVLSIAFNKSHNTMFSGQHQGKFFIQDIRSPDASKTEITLFPSCVVELAILDDYNIIAAGDPGYLLRFDLRKNAVVTKFVGHHQKLKKQALSIVNDMLCANGSDNTVRLWHVSGGTPIHQIHADVPIKGWLNSENNKAILYVYEGAERRIYDVMKRRRQMITLRELRRSTRKPRKKLNLKVPSYYNNPSMIPVAVITPLPGRAATAPSVKLEVMD